MKKTIYRNPKNLNNAITIVEFMISYSTKFIRMEALKTAEELNTLSYRLLCLEITASSTLIAYAISHSLTA